MEEDWDYLSDSFARSRTSDSTQEYKSILWVFEKNIYGFEQWIICKRGISKIK